MRPVKGGKPAQRKTQTRKSAGSARARTTASRRASGVAPGKRRTNPARSFGKRAERPPGRLRRFIENVREGNLPGSPIAFASGVLVAGAVGYGLAVGGHLAAAGVYVTDQSKAAVAWAGFSVDQVTVEGRDRTRSAEVLSALGVERGQMIFDVDLDEARAKLLRLDWVSDATVTRILPDRIHVTLVERRPFAVWQRGGRLAVIDEAGAPITETGVEAYGHLPFVVGHGAARKAGELTGMLASWPELQSRIRAYVRVGDRRWNLRLENGVDVMLPETGVEKALSDLVAIDETHRVLARDIQAIDMRLDDRFTIRLSPDAAARRDAATLEWERGTAGDET